MIDALWVSLGAGLGAATRLHLARLVARRTPDPIWGTTAVNVLGSLMLGVLVGLGVSGTVNLAVGIGFCGAFTTWSTLSHDALSTATRAGTQRAAAVLTASVLCGVAAAILGYLVGSVL